jgi:hypothetical protein
MPKLQLSRLRTGKAGAAGDRGEQASKIWQALLGPFSVRPPAPSRPDPEPSRGPRDG